MNYEKFMHENKDIYLVDMKKEQNAHFSHMVIRSLEKYGKLGKKIAIFAGKKGFSTGVICHVCGFVPECEKCSLSIHYYHLEDGKKMGMCTLCKKQYVYPTVCTRCHSGDIHEFGLGTQKVSQYVHTITGLHPVIIESETVQSINKIKQLDTHLEKSSIFIGTSLLSTPPAKISFDVIIVLQSDVGLHIPDYTAAERTFQFLYELFGKHRTQNFIIQTFNPEHYAIRAACKMDVDSFYEQDNIYREEFQYPPYTDMCMLLYKHEIETTLFTKIDSLYKEILYCKQVYKYDHIEVFSTPPLIYKMFGKYRYHIILKGKNVRHFMDIIFSKLGILRRGFKVDWQPTSITG